MKFGLPMSCRLPIADCRLPIASENISAPQFSSVKNRKSKIGNGFTLIELMMVVAIIGLMMAMGVPAILSMMHEAPLRKAVNDTMEICSHARAQAILSGQITKVTFHPLTRQIETSGAAGAPATRLGQKAVNSTQFDPSVSIAMLDINLMDFGASEVAFVRFFPNGTCDELTMVLQDGDQWRKITLDPITSLASVGNVR